MSDLKDFQINRRNFYLKTKELKRLICESLQFLSSNNAFNFVLIFHLTYEMSDLKDFQINRGTPNN